MPPAGRKTEQGKSASVAPPKRLALSNKTAQAVLVDTEVQLTPESIGRLGSHAYDWAPGKYYAVAPYSDDGIVSRCGKDGREVTITFEIRDMTSGGEGVHLSVVDCKKVQKMQYYFFQAVEFLLPGKFLFIFSAKSTKYPKIDPVVFTITVKPPPMRAMSSSSSGSSSGKGPSASGSAGGAKRGRPKHPGSGGGSGSSGGGGSSGQHGQDSGGWEGGGSDGGGGSSS
ncbi:unnamed protein product, partial [Ascophyllum nodosum]